jgi:hypothetical protein
MQSSPSSLPALVQKALDQGNRMEAIRLLGDLHGLNLKEAMEVIAGLKPFKKPTSTGPATQVTSAPASAPSPEHQVRSHLKRAREKAIQAFGVGASPPENPTQSAEQLAAGLAPGEVPRTSSSWGFALAVALLAWYFLLR